MAKRRVPLAPIVDHMNVPQCSTCRHYREDSPGTCDAFPGGIPNAIIFNEVDHRRPYTGDHGVRWERAEDASEADVQVARA